MRIASDVTLEEVFRLAQAMTFKNAAVRQSGGGKAGIIADPTSSDKEWLARALARLISELDDYTPGPDMGTDETCLAWNQDEIGRAVGLPRVMGGIPLGEISATGFGLAVAAEVAAPAAGLALKDSRVAIQGFGAVGSHAARFLAERGATIIAASDSRGATFNPAGLEVDALIRHKRKACPASSFPGGQIRPRDELLDVACEILIPAARPDVLTEDNVEQLQAKLILQGATIPATEAVER